MQLCARKATAPSKSSYFSRRRECHLEFCGGLNYFHITKLAYLQFDYYVDVNIQRPHTGAYVV